MIEVTLSRLEQTLNRVVELLETRHHERTMTASEWMDSEQCSAYLGCHRDTASRKLREWERSGLVKVGRFGGRLRVRKMDLDAHLLAPGKAHKETPDEITARILSRMK